MDYFRNARSAEEAKKLFKILAKQCHPDNQGRTEDFQDLQSQFQAAWARLRNIHINAEGETYTSDTDEEADEFMDIVERLMRMEGVQTELIGSWLWASGDTRRYAADLKDMGFRFSRPKTAWYYHRGTYRRRHDREYTLDDIRTMYDHKIYRNKEEQKNDRFAVTTR